MSDLCDAINKFGKGIGSAPRYRIVEVLFSGPQTVGKLAKTTKQSQPLVSQHLRVLKEAKLVEDERHGKTVLYRLNAEYMMHLIASLSDELKREKRRCV